MERIHILYWELKVGKTSVLGVTVFRCWFIGIYSVRWWITGILLYYYGTESQGALMNWVCEYNVYLVLVGKPHAKHLLVRPWKILERSVSLIVVNWLWRCVCVRACVCVCVHVCVRACVCVWGGMSKKQALITAVLNFGFVLSYSLLLVHLHHRCSLYTPSSFLYSCS